MSKKKPRRCRICKKSPVWTGGDVKNPGPVCKRCYHKYVWSQRPARPRTRPPEKIDDEAIEPPSHLSPDDLWYLDPGDDVDELSAPWDSPPNLPWEETDDDDEVPF